MGQLFSDQESINKISKLYGSFKQVDQRATIAHLRANINIWGHFRCSSAAKSTVSSPIWLKFELIQNIMYVLITCTFKNIGSMASEIKWKHQFLTLKGSSLCSQSSDLALMYVIITCKYEKDPIKHS